MFNVFEKLKSLPVSNILDDISAHCAEGGIAIVNSETGSGKSLLVPLRMVQDTNEGVFVVEPRRFLAINAAEILSELSETQLGEEFGYLIGHTGSGEENQFDPNKTMTAFTTYGYALATKLIMEEDYIILDEIHEQAIDMAICKALIKYRYRTGNPPKRLVLMSATLDAEREIAYWSDVAPTKVFSVETGLRFKCDRVYLPATPVSAAALALVDEGSSGILIFAPGVGEIQDILKDLNEALMKEPHPKLIISSIHGHSDYEERRQALSSPPDGYVKILVGTNVIESGMNLSWVDAGVTTGEKKELHVRGDSGAIILTKVPLAKTNVDQQAGRTNRFCDSKFVICGDKSYDEMASVGSAEIDRLPLTALYMHCQSIDIDPNTLEFLPQPNREKMYEAETKLKHLGFFDQRLKLTADGKFVQNLPVGLQTAAMLCHAHKLNILADVIPLAAVYEIGTLRKDHTEPHYLDSTSDAFDSLFAYIQAMDIQNNMPYAKRKEMMEDRNISMRRYIDASLIIKTLEHRFSLKSNFDRYISVLEFDRLEKEKVSDLRQCILAASICNMGAQQYGRRGNQFSPAGSFNDYPLSRGTAAANIYQSVPITARLRQIQPRKAGQFPFTVAEQITQFSTEDIRLFGRIRPGVFTEQYNGGMNHFFVNGSRFYSERAEAPETPVVEVSAKDSPQQEGRSLADIIKEQVDSKPDVIRKKEHVLSVPIPEQSLSPFGQSFAEALRKRQARG